MIDRRHLFGFLAVAPVAVPAAVAAIEAERNVLYLGPLYRRAVRHIFKWEIAANGDIKGWTEVVPWDDGHSRHSGHT